MERLSHIFNTVPDVKDNPQVVTDFEVEGSIEFRNLNFAYNGTPTLRNISLAIPKGKTVAIPELGSPHHVFIASMASYVGLDPARDITFVTEPAGESARLLSEKKVNALMGFPPVTQELRAKKIGHVVVNSGVDRPWSQYFCCIAAGNREFVRKHPAASKRALRAILMSANLCSTEPDRAARCASSVACVSIYGVSTIS